MLATQDFRDKDQLLAYLAEAQRRPQARALHCFVFLLNDEFTIEEAFAKATELGLHTNLSRRGDGLFLLGIGVRTSYEVGFLLNLDGNWVFVSDAEMAKLTSTVDAFARNMFPVLKLAYLPSPNLLDLISKIGVKYDRVIVTEGTIGTKNETYRTWKKEPIEFSRQALVSEAGRHQGKWTSISFRCLVSQREVFSCRTYERGHLTLYVGQFPEFYADVLLPYVAQSFKTHKKFRGMERKERQGEVILSPLSISFPNGVSRGDMEVLRGRIIRSYAAAVSHPGNPMLMIRLSDRADGSIYDVYVYHKKVDIVPLQRSTPGSLSELVAMVSDVLPSGISAVV